MHHIYSSRLLFLRNICCIENWHVNIDIDYFQIPIQRFKLLLHTVIAKQQVRKHHLANYQFLLLVNEFAQGIPNEEAAAPLDNLSCISKDEIIFSCSRT